MPYDPDLHHRRSIRLRGYDYSQPGSYYVTICIEGYRNLLGEIRAGLMNRSEAGQVIEKVWREIPSRFPSAQIDESIVMPNHFHGIIRIVEAVGAPLVGAPDGEMHRFSGHPQGVPLLQPAPALGEIIGAFKSITTNQYIAGVRQEVGHSSTLNSGSVISMSTSSAATTNWPRYVTTSDTIR